MFYCQDFANMPCNETYSLLKGQFIHIPVNTLTYLTCGFCSHLYLLKRFVGTASYSVDLRGILCVLVLGSNTLQLCNYLLFTSSPWMSAPNWFEIQSNCILTPFPKRVHITQQQASSRDRNTYILGRKHPQYFDVVGWKDDTTVIAKCSLVQVVELWPF